MVGITQQSQFVYQKKGTPRIHRISRQEGKNNPEKKKEKSKRGGEKIVGSNATGEYRDHDMMALFEASPWTPPRPGEGSDAGPHWSARRSPTKRREGGVAEGGKTQIKKGREEFHVHRSVTKNTIKRRMST